MKSLRLAAAASAALVPLLLVACGSGGSSSLSDLAAAAETAASSSIPAGGPAGTSGSGGATPILAAKCQQVFTNFALSAQGTGSAGTDLDQLAKDLEAMVPARLQGDAKIFADAYQQLAKTMKDKGTTPDPAAMMQAITELSKQPGFQQAAQELGTWFSAGCPAG